MRTFVLALLVLFSSTSAANAAEMGALDRGAYYSVTFGNGRIYGADIAGYEPMHGRSFEVRIGHDILLFGGDTAANATSTVRFDIVHYNEGHPVNNHRDGFAGQLVYSAKLGPVFTAEIGSGIYSSTNTTTIKGVQYDSANRGVLSSAALLISPSWIAPAHIRLGYNHVWMSDTFHSDSLQFGIGRHFTDPPPFSTNTSFWLGAAWERAITNMAGTNGASGASIEARKYFGAFATSATYLREGDDGSRVDRNGAAFQLWFVQPLVPSVTASFGGGPYLARNQYEDNRVRTLGLYTLRFEKNLNERTKLYYSFSRVKTYAQMNDRDLHHLGILFALAP